jgi:hypothetical protein
VPQADDTAEADAESAAGIVDPNCDPTITVCQAVDATTTATTDTTTAVTDTTSSLLP